MKYLILIMVLTINNISSDGTCVLMNSRVDASSKCLTSTAINCDIDDSNLLTTTCINSQYSGVRITTSTTTATRISGQGCSISTCTINEGMVFPSPACKITDCTLSTM